jgi:hypothetical protein
MCLKEIRWDDVDWIDLAQDRGSGDDHHFGGNTLTNWNITLQCEINKNSPITGLEWPRGFQEVKVPRLHDNGTGWW